MFVELGRMNSGDGDKQFTLKRLDIIEHLIIGRRIRSTIVRRGTWQAVVVAIL